MSIWNFPRRNPLGAVFVLAVLLRLAGVIANSEANDPHLEVSQIMAYQHRMPAAREVWEGFQPKLYHGAVAGLLMLLPEPLPDAAQIRVANAVSGIAGVATLWLLLGFIRQLPLSDRSRLLAFTVVALNPKMVATSIQATNDGFVILFATLAVVAGYRFFSSFRTRDFAWLTAGIALACVSKGSGLPLLLAALIGFGAALLQPRIPRARLLGYASAMVVAFVLFVPVVGEYYARYEETGDPFWSSQAPSPAPHFFEETTVKPKRPGITSVFGGYFTFRLANLLEEPIVTNGVDEYEPHRTSLWTFAYASAHTNHFDNYPPSWQLDNGFIRAFLRVLYLLALLPTAILLIGSVRGIWLAVADAFRRPVPEDWVPRFLLAVVAGGYVAFLILYSFQYRDYGTQKPIFIYTAMACFMAYFALQLQRIEQRSGVLLQRLAVGSTVALCVAYFIDTSVLLLHLVAIRLHLL